MQQIWYNPSLAVPPLFVPIYVKVKEQGNEIIKTANYHGGHFWEGKERLRGVIAWRYMLPV